MATDDWQFGRERITVQENKIDVAFSNTHVAEDEKKKQKLVMGGKVFAQPGNRQKRLHIMAERTHLSLTACLCVSAAPRLLLLLIVLTRPGTCRPDPSGSFCHSTH